jgi:hypothetical protein
VAAAALDRPLTATLQHARNLREARGSEEGPVLSAGGRGRNAPAMTHEDAAALLCAILGSENVKDSVSTVASMRKLQANFHGQRGQELGLFRTGIRPEHNVVAALAQVLQCFEREKEIRERHSYHDYYLPDAQLYVLFEVQYPQHYAFITVGVRKKFKETWTYGRRGAPRNEQVRRVREVALREIAQALRSTETSEAE